MFNRAIQTELEWRDRKIFQRIVFGFYTVCHRGHDNMLAVCLKVRNISVDTYNPIRSLKSLQSSVHRHSRGKKLIY